MSGFLSSSGGTSDPNAVSIDLSGGEWQRAGNIWQIDTTLSLIATVGNNTQVIIANPATHFDLLWWVIELTTAITGGTATITLGTSSGGVDIGASFAWTSATSSYTKKRSVSSGSEAGNGSSYDVNLDGFAFDAAASLYLKSVVSSSNITAGAIRLIALGIER